LDIFSGKYKRHLKSRAQGFSLVEVVIALSVVAITFIGLIGLLGSGVATEQTSTQQTIATNIAASILADLRSTPASGTGVSTRYSLTLPTPVATMVAAPLSGVTPTTLYFDNNATYLSTGGTVPANAAFVAKIYLVGNGYIGVVGTPSLQSNDMVRVVVSWPPQTTTVPVGSVDVISQFLVH
jgi:prepilin-type N-terminal cleavage/methylation domain-containing protein